MHRSHDVNESVAYFEGHPELKFGGNNSKRAVFSAFENPDSWLKSFGIKGRTQELCDGVNDVAGVIEDVEEIPTEMVERSYHTKGRSRPYPVPQLQSVEVPAPVMTR